MPGTQKAADRMVQMLLHRVPRLCHRCVGELGQPSPLRRGSAHGPRLPTVPGPGPQPLTDGHYDGRDGLLRRPYPVVAAASPRRVHRAEGVAEEIEGVAPSIPHSRLAAVEREPDAGHPSPGRLEHLGRPGRENDEVIGVGHRHRAYQRSKPCLRNALMNCCPYACRPAKAGRCPRGSDGLVALSHRSGATQVVLTRPEAGLAPAA